MPTIRVPFAAPETPVLPLSAPSIASPGRVRSTGRRLNYNIKSRASHYSLPLTLGGVLALLFFVLRYNHSSHTQPDRPHLYPRSNDSPYESSNNGISLLLSDEDELIAEDDLFWDSYTESDPISDEEIEAEKEIAAHRLDVQQRDRKHALQAMIWWLAEGGVIPSNWEMPGASQMKKISGRGMEKMLESIDKGDEEEPIFAEGWAEYAKKMYRTVVFSKTYCPYSRKAKAIFDTYHLNPVPFVIELDQRSDFKPIQNLLHALIGRRTVPNVILDFTSVGGSDEITLLHAEGGLQRRFEEMEVVPGPRRRKLAEKKPTKVELEAPKDAAAEKFEPVVERESIPVEEPASVVRVEADTDTFEPVLEETPSGPDLKRAIDETPIEKRASVPGEPIEARKVEQAVLAFSEEPIRIATPPLEPLEPLSPDQKPIPPHEPKPRAPLEPRTAKAPPPRQPQENGAAAMVAAAKIHKPRI